MLNAPTEIMNQRFRLPDYVNNVILAGVAKTVTPPTWAAWARVKVTDTVWVDRDATAVVPTVDSLLGAGAFPIFTGDGWEEFPLAGVLSFSVIGTAVFTIAYYGDESKL